MYLCFVLVRHFSKKGKPYIQKHVVPVHQTLDVAVRLCGATPPDNESPCLFPSSCSTIPEIVYTHNSRPAAHDPDHIVVHLLGMPGGVYVSVPYKCTFDDLISTVVPNKLRKFGVCCQDCCGQLALDDGTTATKSHLWTQNAQQRFIWTKLKAHVRHSWPAYFIRGIIALQRICKDRHQWCFVEV